LAVTFKQRITRKKKEERRKKKEERRNPAIKKLNRITRLSFFIMSTHFYG